MNIPDVVGITGVICYQIAYAGLQLGRFQQDDLRYIGLNLLGPACLLYSLVFDFNLAALITQVLWLGITVLGLVQTMRARRRRIPRFDQRCMNNE
ncbi:hypothetical protein GPA27_05850 [Aromatoleum toluolicum]|uniref:Cyclic nucleotide-binding protein n=1 Tax=Aromatoleum toluolicum TaxID=90060 RepID=A0ABX1NCF9_9RHOO|nr:cyclic nucleotide-binding protein [Aromatoleum toluolicum]NMF96908.1 hypothetical protein [Aromatoleum toluolicum]